MMLLLGSLLLVAVSIISTERDYFYKPNATTWDDARLQCQACYKDLTTITPAAAELIIRNLTDDYWIGLRQNTSASKFWSQWANGEPVIYQNWYPGHPVPKKIPVPQPTCPPPPPVINNTNPQVMQCPAFARLCACLNTTEKDDLFNMDNNSAVTEMMCPALGKLCDCLNASEYNPPITVSPTVFTTTHLVTSSTPRMLVSPNSSISTIIDNLEPQYIEDSCVVLLSFGMWQEKHCNESLPYICYDDRFYGDITISNRTQSGGILSWSKAGINISQYRVMINGSYLNETSATSYQIEGLAPGTEYTMQVIPVKCERDLNPQNISFYTLPEKISNLSIVKVGTDEITLSWNTSGGTNVSYLVISDQKILNRSCCPEKCQLTELEPGQMYNFTVKAVVNITIFGEPGHISTCTKPSKVINLTSFNNESDKIIARWDSPDSNRWNYIYNITLYNGTTLKNLTQKNLSLTSMSSLTSGSSYTLTVSVRVPNCPDEEEATSITAYTTPMPVRNLSLNSTNNSITATWNSPEGNFAWFIVNISSSMSQNIPGPHANTTLLNYTFNSLNTATNYTVTVTTYVKEDLNPSIAVNNSTFTKPNSPGKASAEILNNTTVHLRWENPIDSEGVKGIVYSVKYVSEFWGDGGNLTITGNNSTMIDRLKSGSKYNFYVTVLAGGLESLPSETTGYTKPELRKLSLMMLCSSSTQLYCMGSNAKSNILTALNNSIYKKFKDNVFWNLTENDMN
ncbi:receptor-type tyrosine-protein phosphatase eta [Clarias gariepinus]|uniref:receptor-type tyrosine-protein phosphatase eta n=1 Tax=Clarias gariepinus TaxID=13013 RepID=UPI00234E0EEA|nr:receptor-type tyrosine-protein phosphatase eta [Clarias gariepinus]